MHKAKVIGIDEFSFKEGYHYMTVVTDLDTGRVLHAVEGKGKEDIRPFLKSLARRGKKLEAVAMDMTPPRRGSTPCSVSTALSSRSIP